MSEKRIAELVREIIPLLDEATRRFEEEETYRVSVCLDCRKIYVEPWKHCFPEEDDETREDCVCLEENQEYLSCFYEKHTLLELEKYEGPTDIFGALKCLEWILKQAGETQ